MEEDKTILQREDIPALSYLNAECLSRGYIFISPGKANVLAQNLHISMKNWKSESLLLVCVASIAL